MRALTLHRPWPWAIFFAPPGRLKDLENRRWSAHWILDETVAIHAGQHVDVPAFDFIERVCGVRPPEDGGATGIVGMVRFTDMVEQSTSPWFTGPIGWRIGMRQALVQPVPCRGSHKLWAVPADVEALVQARRTAVPLRYVAGGR